jgi:protein-disulfide isomerase
MHADENKGRCRRHSKKGARGAAKEGIGMSELKVPVGANDHIRGPKTAAVTLVEYGDYECPFCGAAHPVVQALGQAFANDLRIVFRHFPLTQIHPNAESAAETAEFAGAHGLFWPMHDALFEQQRWLSIPLLISLVRAFQLSDRELLHALQVGTFRPKVRNDFLGGVRSGVNGTPTFFINNKRHNGSYDYETLSSAIAAQVAQAKVSEPVRIPVRP